MPIMHLHAVVAALSTLLLSTVPIVDSFGVHSKLVASYRSTLSYDYVPIAQRLRSKIIPPGLSTLKQSNSEEDVEPQAIATGYSQSLDLINALTEATNSALSQLPSGNAARIDLGLVYISSLYDGQSQPSSVVPCVLDICSRHYGVENEEVVQKLIGCYAGGLVGSKPNIRTKGNDGGKNTGQACLPLESEGANGVVVTLCLLPDTKIETFHVLGDDVPDDIGRISPEDWKNSVGLRGFESDTSSTENETDDSSTIMLLPSPAFQNELDDFLRGLSNAFGPSATIFGGVASTVSSLSRARLFRFDVSDPYCTQTLGDGCVGVALSGDVQAKVIVAQGTKAVGGVYRVVAGEGSTINAIQLDEVATEQLNADMDGNDVDEEDEESSLEENMNAKEIAAAAYAKAAIPKPVLAEANFLMKTLSDDEQSFMSKSLLVGLERSGGMAKTPNELLRLAQGYGHRFTVHQVASAGMRDGSVTLPLGSVDIEKGGRFRFYVRDGDFAKKEVEALWMGYKKRELEQIFNDSKPSTGTFTPSGCFLFPTLDRGSKLFGGKPGYESSSVSEFLPAIPSVNGFFANGVIAKLGENDPYVMLHGSASCYALIGSKSNRPIYSATEAAAKNKQEGKIEEETQMNSADMTEDDKLTMRAKDLIDNVNDQPAPRSENGELILKRREVHSGRALTVSSVEWSVAENMPTPSSALEGFMWDKETEVDRFRERVPLSNLVSQCNLANMDPEQPNPRDWIKSVKIALQEKPFVIIPEIKRLEPATGSLRRRYDISKLAKQLTLSGAAALSVNCDGVLFGGSIDDITLAREVSSKSVLESAAAETGVVAPPVLASDLILYPYQLYKLRLAGADAVNLIVGALTSKDLLYLTKIASTLKMQIIASVTSEPQINWLTKLSPGSIAAIVVSNRNLETFGFDESGEQALKLLQGDALNEFKNVNADVPVLVEGRVGIVTREGSMEKYLIALKEAGAMGAIVGGGLTIQDEGTKSYELLSSEC